MPDLATSDRTGENRYRSSMSPGVCLAINIAISLTLWGLIWLAVINLAAIWP
jgi:hypothetical protein